PVNSGISSAVATRKAARKKSIRERTSSAYRLISAILKGVIGPGVREKMPRTRTALQHESSTSLRPKTIEPMHKPIPKPVDPAEVPALARDLMRVAKFPLLATVDGDQPRVRPVSPVRTENFTVYVANLRGYHKTEEIAANPRVELCYVDHEHNQVRITGIAEVLRDDSLLHEIWSTNP